MKQIIMSVSKESALENVKVKSFLPVPSAIKQPRPAVRTTTKAWESLHLTAAANHARRSGNPAPVSQSIASAIACDVILESPVTHKILTARALAGLAELLCVHASALPGSLSGQDVLPISHHAHAGSTFEISDGQTHRLIGSLGRKILCALNMHAVAPDWMRSISAGAQFSISDRHALLTQAIALLPAAQQLLADWDDSYDESAPGNECVDGTRAMIALITEDGKWSLSGPRLCVMDVAGHMLECAISPERLDDVIGRQSSQSASTAFYRPFGAQRGRFIAGPLARINIAEAMGTPTAATALSCFQKRFAKSFRRKALAQSFVHHARMIEIIATLEHIIILLSTGATTGRTDQTIFRCCGGNTGVGMVESPFGTLIHRYHVGSNSAILQADLFVTG